MRSSALQGARPALVGIASVAGFRGLPGSGAYCASKAAAIAYLESLRVELHGSGVAVITICPGYVATDMTADVTALPAEKMIQPGAIAALVATVLSLPNSASVAEIPVNCRLEHSL